VQECGAGLIPVRVGAICSLFAAPPRICSGSVDAETLSARDRQCEAVDPDEIGARSTSEHGASCRVRSCGIRWRVVSSSVFGVRSRFAWASSSGCPGRVV
jgi:hypothetical protein